MMKTITRTYQIVCKSCSGSGSIYPMVQEPYTNSFTSICKACKGIGLITVTEIETSDLPPSEEKKEEARQFNPALDLMIKPGQCKYCGRSDK